MNVYATIVVSNANKEAAQALVGDGFFDILLKKGFSKYWVSSSPFLEQEYDVLVESGLTYEIDTDNSLAVCLANLGLTKVVEE